jgi:hypothetical protein
VVGAESWPSKKPVRRLEDFKGLKIRVPQGMEADLLTRLGASVVVLPGTEIYSALDKGVVDATNWSVASDNDRLGFHKVAPYFTYPGFHSMPRDFAVNEREWTSSRPTSSDAPGGLPAVGWDVIQCWPEDLKIVVRPRRNIHPSPGRPRRRCGSSRGLKVWADWKKNEDAARSSTHGGVSKRIGSV